MKKFLLVALSLLFTCNINSFAESKYSNKYIGVVIAECCNDFVSAYDSFFNERPIAITTAFPTINIGDSLKFDHVIIPNDSYSDKKELPKKIRKQLKKGTRGIISWYHFKEDVIWLGFSEVGIFKYKKERVTVRGVVPDGVIYELKYNPNTKEWEILACASKWSKYWDPNHELFSKKIVRMTPIW